MAVDACSHAPGGTFTADHPLSLILRPSPRGRRNDAACSTPGGAIASRLAHIGDLFRWTGSAAGCLCRHARVGSHCLVAVRRGWIAAMGVLCITGCLRRCLLAPPERMRPAPLRAVWVARQGGVSEERSAVAPPLDRVTFRECPGMEPVRCGWRSAEAGSVWSTEPARLLLLTGIRTGGRLVAPPMRSLGSYADPAIWQCRRTPAFSARHAPRSGEISRR